MTERPPTRGRRCISPSFFSPNGGHVFFPDSPLVYLHMPSFPSSGRNLRPVPRAVLPSFEGFFRVTHPLPALQSACPSQSRRTSLGPFSLFPAPPSLVDGRAFQQKWSLSPFFLQVAFFSNTCLAHLSTPSHPPLAFFWLPPFFYYGADLVRSLRSSFFLFPFFPSLRILPPPRLFLVRRFVLNCRP